jgi:hypothetical protein
VPAAHLGDRVRTHEPRGAGERPREDFAEQPSMTRLEDMTAHVDGVERMLDRLSEE